MEPAEFDLDKIINGNEAAEMAPTEGVARSGIQAVTLLPNLSKLKPFLISPSDSSWISKIGKLPARELKKKASDILMDEALPIMLNSGSINLRVYLISRFFCSRADACECATMSRSDYTNSEVFSAISSVFDSDIRSDADLLGWAKKSVIRYPSFLHALSGFIKPIASKF